MAPSLEPVKYQRQAGRPARNPFGKKLDIFTPLLTTHVFENAGTFTNATIVIPKDFNRLAARYLAHRTHEWYEKCRSEANGPTSRTRATGSVTG